MSPTGRVKRRSAQAAEDAQLARAMQDEWMRVGHKRQRKDPQPHQEHQQRNDSVPAEKRGKSSAFSGIGMQESGVKHFITRNRAGFLEADVRRGCCFCDACAAKVAEELVSGSGLAVFRGAFSAEVAAQAREEVTRIKEEDEGGKRGLGRGELGPCHSRIWSLLNHGPPFTLLVQLGPVVKALALILGDDFALGSFSANDIGPGCPRGPAHVDYPYSTLSRFPNDVVACQAIYCLDSWSQANGGTQVELHSQKTRLHPDREDALETVVEGKPGDVIIYHSLLHHRSGGNVTGEHRIGLLGQFLAKYVRPMEDQATGVKESVRRGASKALRQLLALDYPFPILNPQHSETSSNGTPATSLAPFHA